MEKSSGIIPIRWVGATSFEVLLVEDFRGNWGFPKGHVQEGESLKETAERELFEETGLTIKKWWEAFPPFVQSYTFLKLGFFVEKEVHLFVADVEGKAYPQPGEILSLKWISPGRGAPLATFNETKELLLSLPALIKSHLP